MRTGEEEIRGGPSDLLAKTENATIWDAVKKPSEGRSHSPKK